VIDHIEAAIAQLEAAKDAAQGMYLNTCNETSDQDVLTISGDGGSKFLLMIEMLARSSGIPHHNFVWCGMKDRDARSSVLYLRQ